MDVPAVKVELLEEPEEGRTPEEVRERRLPWANFFRCPREQDRARRLLRRGQTE